VFATSIENACSGCTADEIENSLDSVGAHELAHNWNVNPPEGTTGGHDSEDAWNGGKCLMNVVRDLTLGVVRFHTAPGLIDLYCIRGHVDDLNQDSCTWP